MSDPLWRNTKFRVSGDEQIVAMAKQFIRLLSGEDDTNQSQSYVEKLLTDGIETTVDEFLIRPSFDTVELAFEYYSSDAFKLYERLLEEVSRRGPEYGAVEYRCAHFTNSIHPYGNVRVTDVDLSSNDDEWCTEVDQTITITARIDDLCEVLGCNPNGLWTALENDGGSVLEGLLKDDLAETIFGGDEAELMSFELGSDAGSHILEFVPGAFAPTIHCSLDMTKQEWSELLSKVEESAGRPLDLILAEPTEDLDADMARLEFQPNDMMFRGAALSDYIEYRAAYEEAASSRTERGGTIELKWEDELEETTGVASFAAAEGFKMLSFETGPNHWGDFKAIEYTL